MPAFMPGAGFGLEPVSISPEQVKHATLLAAVPLHVLVWM
jgi:hypothetical protein